MRDYYSELNIRDSLIKGRKLPLALCQFFSCIFCIFLLLKAYFSCCCYVCCSLLYCYCYWCCSCCGTYQLQKKQWSWHFVNFFSYFCIFLLWSVFFCVLCFFFQSIVIVVIIIIVLVTVIAVIDVVVVVVVVVAIPTYKWPGDYLMWEMGCYETTGNAHGRHKYAKTQPTQQSENKGYTQVLLSWNDFIIDLQMVCFLITFILPSQEICTNFIYYLFQLP